MWTNSFLKLFLLELKHIKNTCDMQNVGICHSENVAYSK